MSLNQWTGIGYIENDIEFGKTKSDLPYARFILATIDSWSDKDGKKGEQTFYHNIVVWNEFAIEKLLPNLNKGNLLFVQAPLRHRKYEDGGEKAAWASELVYAKEGIIKFLGSSYSDMKGAPELEGAPAQLSPFLNQWSGIGNVGRDPEFGETKSGLPVANFSIATTDYKVVDGKRIERTEWHRIVVWNEHLLEKVLPHVKKGQSLSVQGPLRHRSYQDSSGKERSASEIVLTFDGKIRLLGSKKEGHGPAHHPMADSPDDGANIREREMPPREAGDPGPSAEGDRVHDDLDDEIPFAPEFR
jgi:single-strand DNA-binding protein